MKDTILVNGAPLTRKDFAATIPEFGIMPFWFVNGGMDYDEMVWQLREFKAKGIPGIFFHARFGVLDSIGYLTEDWFDRVRFCVQEAEKIGLQIWIYDEYNWPSGTAGKTLMKEHPKLTQKYLEMMEGDVPGQLFVFMEGTDSRYTDLEQSEPVYCCAILKKDLEEKRFRYVNLMPNLAFDKVITWEAPQGPWRTCYFVEKEASWYADVLNPETTQVFLQMVHERYKQAMGGDVSGKLHGFFTDEPAMHYFEVGRDNLIIPWSKDMFGIFKRRRHYDLREQLPKLFYDFEGAEQVRYDFWSCLSDQYEETYYKALADWCHQNGTLFTGHLMHEESIRAQARTGGNLFHMLRHMDIVGIDHLYPRVGTREMMNEHVAIKIASSAAHHYGSARLICESMGGSYWDCTMERMKWIADWEYVLGVNIFNPHGFHYSIEGERKRDWPPSMFYHHTWWGEYKRFNDYLSRAGYLLSGGVHVAKIAILYPMTSMWAHYQPQICGKNAGLIQDEFNFLTDRLLRLHTDYDYLDEDVLAECVIENGCLKTRGEVYECVVLPGVTHLKKASLEKLDAFVHQGGHLLLDTLAPYALVDGDDAQALAASLDWTGYDAREMQTAWEAGTPLNRDVTERKTGAGKVVLMPAVACDGREDLLRRAVLFCVTPEIEIDNDEIFYLHRIKDGQNLFYLVNPTHEPQMMTVKLRGEWALSQWDLLTGGVTPLYVYSVGNGETTVHIDLPAVGSIMLGADAYHGEMHVDSADIHVTGIENGMVQGYQKKAEIIDVSGPFRFSHDTPNALVMDHWLAYVNENQKTAEEIAASDENMLPFKMGVWELQLPTERENACYPVSLAFKARFCADYIPEDLKIMIDGFKCDSWQMFLNGAEVTGTPQRSYLDAEIMTLDIAQQARTGENVLVMMMQVSQKNAGLLDNLKIIGSFALSQDDTIICPGQTIGLGDWTTQGYPFLSANAAYETTVVLSDIEHQEIFLEADVLDDMFTLTVNGQDAGACMWQPYRLDITPFVHPGENHITVHVANTMQNLLRGERKKSGLFGCRIALHQKEAFHVPPVD